MKHNILALVFAVLLASVITITGLAVEQRLFCSGVDSINIF